jgi:SAM-dependent methyltransferase
MLGGVPMATSHPGLEALESMDWMNRRAWRATSVVRSFRRKEGWTDPGERAAVESVRTDAADQPILDLGVGAGRTVPLLLSISRDYVGLDYTPEMVWGCREEHPGVQVVHGDARDLARFHDGSFQLVVFSSNGIDAVNPVDRLRVLREAHRVLRVGGALLFSTHNKDGPGHRERLRPPHPPKLAGGLARALVDGGRALWSYPRHWKLAYDGDGYAVHCTSADDDGVIVHYITLERQLRQVESVGFRPGALAWASSDGRPLSFWQDASDASSLHLVARK